MLLDVFSPVKNLLRLRVIVIDNVVFQLHYRWTVAVLVAFSILVNLKQFFGEAIVCNVDFQRRDLVEKYCWAETTFTIPVSYNAAIGTAAAAPGLGNSHGFERKYHAYYQWVGLTLFFQAILFLIPRFIWKSEEGELMMKLVSGLNDLVSKEENDTKMNRLIIYLKASWRTHNSYVIKYLFCELLNFVNIVGQLIFMEKFLGGEFSSHGVEMLGTTKESYGVSEALFPGYRVFPRLTKCIFHFFGSGGNLNKRDALCLLPLNVIHEKIYLFLFIWFIVLAIVSGLVIIVRLLSLLSFQYREMALASHIRLCSRSTVNQVCQECTFSDWFFLKLIAKNVSSKHSLRIVNGIANELPDRYRKSTSASVATIEDTTFC